MGDGTREDGQINMVPTKVIPGKWFGEDNTRKDGIPENGSREINRETSYRDDGTG